MMATTKRPKARPAEKVEEAPKKTSRGRPAQPSRAKKEAPKKTTRRRPAQPPRAESLGDRAPKKWRVGREDTVERHVRDIADYLDDSGDYPFLIHDMTSLGDYRFETPSQALLGLEVSYRSDYGAPPVPGRVLCWVVVDVRRSRPTSPVLVHEATMLAVGLSNPAVNASPFWFRLGGERRIAEQLGFREDIVRSMTLEHYKGTAYGGRDLGPVPLDQDQYGYQHGFQTGFSVAGEEFEDAMQGIIAHASWALRQCVDALTFFSPKDWPNW